MKKMLPIILGAIGLLVGLGAGVVLKPAPEIIAECDPEAVEGCAEEAKEQSYLKRNNNKEPVYDPENPTEFVKMPKQFVVPVIKRERVAALVVLSISLEVDAGTADPVLSRGPKLRDAFLQVLFKHAASGGFDGAFTTGQAMKDLRSTLRDVAERHTGQGIHGILITDLVKQAV